MADVRIELSRNMFGDAETVIAQTEGISVRAFCYASGTNALRIKTYVGEVIMLPFQGQQIWDATFFERSLRMKSMFDMPIPYVDFLRTYGAFLIHCGATAVGPPGPDDAHPPHGELPNAHYASAYLEFGDGFICVGGVYRHTVAFQTDYEFRPSVRIFSNKSVLNVSVELRNLKRTPMDVYYLAHVNFRGEDGVAIYDNATDLRLRDDLPSHVTPSSGFAALMDRLREDPNSHRTLRAGEGFDPEVVMFLGFEDDEAIALARHPDGTGDVIRYERAVLSHALRWISRTPDQDCLGLVLPSTCDGEGRSAERAKGHAISLGAGESYRCSYDIGALDREETTALMDQLGAAAPLT